MITPPLSISAMPRLTRAVPVTGADSDMAVRTPSDGAGLAPILRARPGPLRRPIGRSRPVRGSGASGGDACGGVQRRVVDVEVRRAGVPAGQPEQPYRQPAAHGQSVAHHVVVYLA